MQVLSLCSGIGALDLALAEFGYRTVAYAETASYPSKVLERRIHTRHLDPGPNLGDLRRIDPEDLERSMVIHLVAGGIPCQGNSHAGSRKGHDDARNLWPEFWEIARTLDASIFLENVRGLLSVNPSGDARDFPLLFGKILSDLHSAGYAAQWLSTYAVDAGAPHLRDRVFLFAKRQAHALPPARQRFTLETKFPAPRTPSMQQYAYEPPRTVDVTARVRGTRVPRLRALGNAVCPQQAAFALERLGQRWREISNVAVSSIGYITKNEDGLGVVRRHRDEDFGELPGAIPKIFPGAGLMIPDGKVFALPDAHTVSPKRLDLGCWPTPDAAVSNDRESVVSFEARRARSRIKEPTRNGNGQGTPLAIAVRVGPTPTATPWATPTVQDAHNNGAPSQLDRNTLPLNAQVAEAGRALNPEWVEMLMGLPEGWTTVPATHDVDNNDSIQRSESLPPTAPALTETP
jgi:DNA (cytosine-5)-methyltransferase 1